MWSDGSTTSSITVSPTVTTPYSVTESNGTCTATASATVTVAPFSITINPDTTQSCVAAPVTLTCSYTSPNTTGYTWSSVPAATSPGNSQGVVVYPLVTTVYSVTVTNTGNCSASATAVVTVNSLPLTVTPDTAGICVGGTTTLTATSASAISFHWSNNISTNTNAVSPTVTTQYNVTATDAHGCTATDSAIVLVGTVPSATFTVTSPVCQGINSSITYTGTSSPAAIYSWNFGTGTPASGTTKGPYQVNWNSPGAQTVILNITDNGCSAAPDTMTVNVLPFVVLWL